MKIVEYLEQESMTQAEFGELVGLSQGRISHYVNGEKVEPERCLIIEKATEGHITRYDLRPDLFGEAPRNAA